MKRKGTHSVGTEVPLPLGPIFQIRTEKNIQNRAYRRIRWSRRTGLTIEPQELLHLKVLPGTVAQVALTA